jgi:tetratricopeptide (TPR) repeat protein
MGDRTRAMADCESCLAIRTDKDALSLRGDLWLQREDLEKAIADYEAAERFDEQVAQAYELRAAAHKQADRLTEAAADQSRAAEIRSALAAPEVQTPAAAAADPSFNP